MFKDEFNHIYHVFARGCTWPWGRLRRTLEFMSCSTRALLGLHVHVASGRLYNVLNNALCEETLKPLVVYAQVHATSSAPGRRACPAGTVWVRCAIKFARKFAPAASSNKVQ